MKKLTGALVLSFSLLLISGCRSGGETRGAEDASTPSSATSGTEQGLTHNGDNAGSGSAGAAQPAPGVDLGGMKEDSGTTTGQGVAAGKGANEGSTSATLSEAERQAQLNCLDKWLQSKKLDMYGHPEGTMYAGGSPLFNEMTGESRDRLDYVYQRQPEAKKACAAANPGTPPKKQ